MHEVDVLLYIIAAVSFFLALVLPLRRVPPEAPVVWYTAFNWIALGLLAWVLVPALKVWGL
jgi:hypothetical protein